MFDYSNKPPQESSSGGIQDQARDDQLEGADKDASETMVVDRRWYEKNKHIYPASLWVDYEPGKEFEEKMASTRRDASGNVFFF